MKRLFNYQMKEREQRMANDNKLKFAADATAAKCWQGELLISYSCLPAHSRSLANFGELFKDAGRRGVIWNS
jgi:hypothetical protein